MSFLRNKNILLGITGSIAAYKSADLTRKLRELSANVRVAMTDSAKRFITPLTMQALSGNPVHDDLFDLKAEAAMGHIELARWADLILIAPTTADFMAKLAMGEADDLLSTVCLATKAKVAIAPAMNQQMWRQAFTQSNRDNLIQKNIHIIGPSEGSQACGDIGPGRMSEPDEIIKEVIQLFSTGELAGLKVLITAGPTKEPIDPVRFISNESSGKMGYALAAAAISASADVTLISGPVNLSVPEKVTVISVTTADEMYFQVMRNIADCDIFLSVAAVADYRCKTISSQKIHKTDSDLQLTLEKNPDIVFEVGQLSHKPFVVGFAAETENVIANAKAKRMRKKMDMIIANEVSNERGMHHDENEVTVITEKEEISLPLTSKDKLGRQLITLIAKEYRAKI